MFETHLGEIISVATALCWTATALFFQQATRSIGSLSVNMFRLLISFLLFGTVSVFIRGEFIPTDATAHQWTWLTISGLIGFVLGDFFLFRSFEYITARVSMLIMAINPLFAALISLAILGELMSWIDVLAMFITLFGIGMVILQRNKAAQNEGDKGKTLSLSFPIKGILFALLGAIGQASGLVLSKYGMQDYNVFAATHIRVIAGVLGFLLIVLINNKWRVLARSLGNGKGMRFTVLGAVFGPFAGVYLSLLSVKYTSVGIASTIMAIVPVLIIPPAVLFYKEKVGLRGVIGAIIAVAGVSLFFVV